MNIEKDIKLKKYSKKKIICILSIITVVGFLIRINYFSFEVPIIVCVIGEGGSGGALGVAVADYVIVLENAYYSVISPEGCAAILWKDRSFASDASCS